ncbi:miraculin-like [Neltuma alba]|uniref:miraculin-like n=1 Tax=Neltuma alba TaxID=207710 RepID=UPI0010A51D96|nr:miraculin-like [Prosopis alba]
MKITFVAFVLLFAFATKPLLRAADAAPEQVVDTSGKVLRAGANYYVFPAPATPNGSGLSLASIGEECPLDVVVVQGYSGLPLSFTPVNPKKGVVRVSTDLNVVFSGDTDCPQSNVWKLDDYDDTTGQWFVTTGGVIGNPGWQTVNNWFNLEKYEDSYKLTYCPKVCSNCTVQCKDIGIYVDSEGYQRLALSDSPYKVQFQRA